MMKKVEYLGDQSKINAAEEEMLIRSGYTTWMCEPADRLWKNGNFFIKEIREDGFQLSEAGFPTKIPNYFIYWMVYNIVDHIFEEKIRRMFDCPATAVMYACALVKKEEGVSL